MDTPDFGEFLIAVRKDMIAAQLAANEALRIWRINKGKEDYYYHAAAFQRAVKEARAQLQWLIDHHTPPFNHLP